MTPTAWRLTIALLASIQVHTVLWGCALPLDSAPARLTQASTPLRYERSVEVDPTLDAPFAEGEGGDLGASTRQGQGGTAERRSSSGTLRGKGAKLAKSANITTSPSLDWLYARVAARANEAAQGQGAGGGGGADGDGEGAKGEPGPWRTPAHVANSDWRSCPASVATRPAYAHVIADVDSEGHALGVRLLDADPGTGKAALQCAMNAHYIPARDAHGNPVRGRTRVFRVEFPL